MKWHTDWFIVQKTAYPLTLTTLTSDTSQSKDRFDITGSERSSLIEKGDELIISTFLSVSHNRENM